MSGMRRSRRSRSKRRRSSRRTSKVRREDEKTEHACALYENDQQCMVAIFYDYYNWYSQQYYCQPGSRRPPVSTGPRRLKRRPRAPSAGFGNLWFWESWAGEGGAPQSNA